MRYVLGAKSQSKLVGVHPHLTRVVNIAISKTSQDFSVHDGVRTAEEQKEKFDAGVSQIDGVTKIGRHQMGEDGWGHAVDLVPYHNGRLYWEWNLVFPFADAVKASAEELGIALGS